MAMSKETKGDLLAVIGVFFAVAVVVCLIFGIGYIGYLNGQFAGACEYAGGSVTDSLCVDGNTVLFTYDTWNE